MTWAAARLVAGRLGIVTLGAAAVGLLAKPRPSALAEAGAAVQQAPSPWTVGETLNYRLKLGLFNVGRAQLKVLGIETVRGVPCYHVQFTIRARALTYTLQDSLQSWFGVQDMVSRRFHQDANENGKIRVRHYEILPEHGIWVRNDTDTGQTVEDPLDDASFFFFARTLNLENGQVYSYARYFVAPNNPVTLRVLGREDNTGVPAGRFPTFVVRPTFRSGGMFGERGQAAIWFTDDDRRIPIRIRAAMAVGTLDLSLTSIE